jgi:hypothetical protein
VYTKALAKPPTKSIPTIQSSPNAVMDTITLEKDLTGIPKMASLDENTAAKSTIDMSSIEISLNSEDITDTKAEETSDNGDDDDLDVEEANTEEDIDADVALDEEDIINGLKELYRAKQGKDATEVEIEQWLMAIRELPSQSIVNENVDDEESNNDNNA